jgi:hypothetical protein
MSPVALVVGVVLAVAFSHSDLMAARFRSKRKVGKKQSKFVHYLKLGRRTEVEKGGMVMKNASQEMQREVTQSANSSQQLNGGQSASKTPKQESGGGQESGKLLKIAGSLKTIHLIDGEKGGVGKSLFSRVMLSYCKENNLSKDIVFLEADLSNPDVGTIYFGKTGDQKKYEEVEFSNDERKRENADRVFELAMEKSVIVNLPSNIYAAVTDWLDRNHVIELGKQHNVRVCKWFLCTGGHSSIEKFKESVEKFKTDIIHVFVRNKVIYDDWSSIDSDDDLQQKLKNNSVLQMDLPRLDFAERNLVDYKQMTFGKALEDGSGFGVLSKQRIKNFLEGTYTGFDQLGLLP